MTDLIKPVLARDFGFNKQLIFRFENRYGASVIQGPYTYGGDQGLFELAVLRFTGAAPTSFELTYDTPITEDVEGYLSGDDVQALLVRIRALGADGRAVESAEQPAIESAEVAR
jgi:hypothetical protein